MSHPALPAKKHKFIITNKANLATNKVALSTVCFMEPYLQIAAYKRGFEVWALGFNTFQGEGDDRTCKVSQIIFRNINLLEIILADYDIIQAITTISETDLIKPQKHDLKRNPLSIYRFNALLKNKDFIALITKIAHTHGVSFDESSEFIEGIDEQHVRLRDFCTKSDIVYLRYANSINLDLFKELEEKEISFFPVSTASFSFNDKTIVIKDEFLRKYSTTTKLIPSDASEDCIMSEIIDFYNEYCLSEGLVVKPENGGGGNGIVFIEAGFDLSVAKQEELKAEIVKKRLESKKTHKERYAQTVLYGGIILQKRVYALVMDETSLPTGDVRITIINGEIFGYAMRYGNEEGFALSYSQAKNILPNSLPFTETNIRHFIELNAANIAIKQYYENLLYMHEAAQKIAIWCKEHKHFHIGVDFLIGRDSVGNYVSYLTELNNITPDGILESMLVNKEVKEEQRFIDIGGEIVLMIIEGRCINIKTPARDIMSTTSTAKLEPAAKGRSD